MSADEPGAGARARARGEAARWLARHDRGLTAAEQDAFHQWLAADPRHGAWFARHRRGWDRLDRIAAWHPRHGAEPNPEVLARPPRARRWLRPAWLAAAAMVILTGLALQRAAFTEPRAASAPGGYERRELEDGSTVELAGGTEIEVHFTPGERRVALRRGEALFTVARHPARPFIVQAGGVNVRAVGTAFNVRLEAARVEVLVTEGRVQVAPPASRAAPPMVQAGELAVVALAAEGPPAIGPATEAARARLRAWQPRILDFSAAPLAEVIAELNRRNRIQITLADPALGKIVIAASIRSDNLDGFVHLLATTAHLRAERQGDHRIVLHSSD